MPESTFSPPVPRAYGGGALSAVRSRGPLPWLDWRFSLIFPMAVVLAIVTLLWSFSSSVDYLEVQVTDETTGNALAGAKVSIGGLTYPADDDGRVRIDRPGDDVTIQVTAEGYQSKSGEFSSDSSSTQRVGLVPATLAGRITDSVTGEPLENVAVGMISHDGTLVSSVSTGADGSYALADVPAGARVRIDAGAYGVHEAEVGATIVQDFSFEIQRAEGLVRDDGGEPLQGAVIQSGAATSITGGDGRFVIDGVRDGATITVSAAGFADFEAVVSNGAIEDVALVPQQIKAIYADLNLMMEPGGIERHVEIANTTEINAIVIDIKENTIFYDSDVPFFEDVGTINPIYDVVEVLDLLKENDIYAIARLVVFQDPLVAEARPDLAVKDTETGDLWRNDIGIAWVSAYEEELWDANVALALEAVELGFDEVQYDYVRFPSDGDLNTVDFGREYTAESREAAITGFMKLSYEAIHSAGGKLAADLFGYVTLVDEEQWIGQRFSSLEPYLDYVCMMIYPSHFSEGNIMSAPGHPNDYPYETIYESLERAEELVPGSAKKFRPWLQDFTYYGMREYTTEDVRLQIDAAEDFGASGWMLWGDPMYVTVDALEPED